MVLLHGGEDGGAWGNIFFLCYCRVSRSYRTYSMVTRGRHLLSRRFLSSQVSSVIARTFPFARKLAMTSHLKFKGIFSKFYLQSAI